MLEMSSPNLNASAAMSRHSTRLMEPALRKDLKIVSLLQINVSRQASSCSNYPSLSKVARIELRAQSIRAASTSQEIQSNSSPRREYPKPLPPNYKSTLRRVTTAIVALPIAIVTSWVLYQRLVLGKERKVLVSKEPPSTDNDK